LRLQRWGSVVVYSGLTYLSLSTDINICETSWKNVSIELDMFISLVKLAVELVYIYEVWIVDKLAYSR